MAGIAVVIAGTVSEITIIGTLGFVLAVAGAYWFLYGVPKRTRAGGPPP